MSISELTHVGFLAHVKIASRIVSYRIVLYRKQGILSELLGAVLCTTVVHNGMHTTLLNYYTHLYSHNLQLQKQEI